jgi:N-acetylglucosaminyldiphosphoundecaprenol N-acetyl-beta-D-mannosaminyltransferase
MKEDILGYNINTENLEVYCDEIITAIKSRRKCWMACFNPHSFAISLRDLHFKRALKEADWLTPDGIGIIIASYIFGGKILERVTGSDIFYGVHQRVNRLNGIKVFFLGTTTETLNKIKSKIAQDYPNIEVVGCFSPPYKPNFTDTEIKKMIERINISKPDILWVGMGAPKQEKWIYDNLDHLDVKFVGAIGAVFDFYAGGVKRAHPIFQRFGLEWLPRLLQQPRRLWRRMLISAPLFLLHVVKKKLRTSKYNH